MLGPALKALFVDLHQQDKLTKFETDIHRELLDILVTDHFARSVLGRRAGVPVHYVAAGSTADVQDIKVSRSYVRNIPGGIGEILGSGPYLNLQVDLSGGDGDDDSPGMQVGCKKLDCPFKKKK